jgi:superfamily II DNA/RNA helicase
MVIIDEADEFFKEDRNLKYLEGLNNTVLSKLKKKIQWAMFSATYPEDVTNSIERLVKDACMVSITKP